MGHTEGHMADNLGLLNHLMVLEGKSIMDTDVQIASEGREEIVMVMREA